jgi:ATP-dependent Lon protease
MLGVADWNTLSAMLQDDRRDADPVARPEPLAASYSAVPLRDFVPFPAATFPIFVGREKTMNSLDQALEHRRDVVLAIQRESGVDEPGLQDVHEVGILAQLIESERMTDGGLRVLMQARRRVAIRRFGSEAGAYQADVAEVREGPVVDARQLIETTVKRFETYAASHEIRLRPLSPRLDRIPDAGRVADLIAAHMILPIGDKQELLATLDPVKRLERVDDLLGAATLRLSPAFEATRRRAIDYARQRFHQYTTLEHLLLALLDDADASAVMRAGNVDLGALKTGLLGHLGEGREGRRADGDARPTPAFHRVMQRARLRAQELGHVVMTGTDALLGLLAETESPAARLLTGQGLSHAQVADLVARGDAVR